MIETVIYSKKYEKKYFLITPWEYVNIKGI